MVRGASLSLQIALASSLLAGDYYFTYSLVSKQLVVSSERGYISKAIVPLGTKVLYETSIENIKPSSQTEPDFIKDHFEDIISSIMSYKVKVGTKQLSVNDDGLSEKTELSIKPTPIRVDFNDDFVTIKVLQE